MSTLFRNLPALFAVAGGAAAIAVFMQRKRTKLDVAEKQQLKSDLRDWESEGGNLAPAAIPPPPPPH